MILYHPIKGSEMRFFLYNHILSHRLLFSHAVVLFGSHVSDSQKKAQIFYVDTLLTKEKIGHF